MSNELDLWPEAEEDGPLPPDHWRKCGRCEEQFWCVPQRSRPTYTPLFCAACDRLYAEELRAKTARWRAREAAKRAADADERGLADALLKRK